VVDFYGTAGSVRAAGGNSPTGDAPS